VVAKVHGSERRSQVVADILASAPQPHAHHPPDAQPSHSCAAPHQPAAPIDQPAVAIDAQHTAVGLVGAAGRWVGGDASGTPDPE